MLKVKRKVKKAKKWLRKIANIDLETFFTTINEVAYEHDKFIPFMFKKGKPKTEEESERKWIEEQKQIEEYHDAFPAEILAFTKRDDELALVSHGLTKGELEDGIDEAIQNGSFDNKTEHIFFR